MSSRFRLTAALALAFAAQAQAQDRPPEVEAAIEEASSFCDGEFSAAPEAVTAVDLNGDGTEDWVVDQSAMSCSTSATLYCGTEGCGIDTFIDGKHGSLLLQGWEVVTEGGKTLLRAPSDSGTADFLWDAAKGEWVLQSQ